MTVQLIACSTVLCLAAPLCQAAIPCSTLNPISPQFSSTLTSVGEQAGIAASRFNPYHRQVALTLCAGRDDGIDDLIDQGRVTAREVSAIRRVLVMGDSPSQRATERPPAPKQPATGSTAEKVVVRKPDGDESASIDRAVDRLFQRWAQSWFTDRYVRDSAHVSELTVSAGEYVVKGGFSFMRYGALATIPFASRLRRGSDGFAVSNLCYNDTTSGMTDCTSSGANSAASRLMGAVIVGGIIAGMNEERPSQPSRSVGDMVNDDRQRQEKELNERQRKAEAETQNKAWHDWNNSPSPLLDPPKTLN